MKNEIQEVTVGDYLVASYADKSCLIRVTHVRGEDIKGVWEYKDSEQNVELPLSSVSANLGKAPREGTIYGCKTERLRSFSETKAITSVEWWFDADEEVQDKLHEGIMQGARTLRKHGLHKVLSVCKAKVVFNTAKSLTSKTVLGTYSAQRASIDKPDIITIKYHADMMKMIPYLICHEVGHGIWHRVLNDNVRAAWIKNFLSYAQIIHYPESLTAAACASAVRVGSLMLDDPEEQIALDAAVANVIAATGLRRTDIGLLLRTELSAFKSLMAKWRAYGTFDSTWDVGITDYASTNPEECFCECLAAFATGTILPESYEKLWEETHTFIKANAVNVPDED